MKYIYTICVILLVGCSVGTVNQRADKEFIYHKKNASVLDIYNLSKYYFSSESVQYLKNRNFKYGEFGGSIKDCSTDEYYCMIGGIGVAIPKIFIGQTEWQFQNISCKAAMPLTPDQTAVINCFSSGWSNQFTYSLDRGITSYNYAGQPQIEYELIDEKGLFANPSGKNQ